MLVNRSERRHQITAVVGLLVAGQVVPTGTTEATGTGPTRSGLVLEPASRGQGCLLAQTCVSEVKLVDQCATLGITCKRLALESQVMSCFDNLPDNCLQVVLLGLS